MSTRRKYANPPVVEALCEVYFADGKWDETVPGRFFDALQPLGFAVAEPVERQEAHVLMGPGVGPSAGVRTEKRMRFRSADRTRVAQLEPGIVVVNQLRPYPTFEQWSPSVVEVAKVFATLVGAVGVMRIALRYINQIVLPGTKVDLEDWFLISPKLPPSWQDKAGSFVVRAERRVDSELGIILTFGSAPSGKPDESTFTLDLYATVDLPTPEGVAGIGPRLGQAHQCIEQAFESSIKDALRTRFDTVPTP